MRWIGLLLSVLVYGVACDDDRPPTGSASRTSIATGGETMDAEDAVPVTDRSGAAAPVAERKRPDGTRSEDIEVELEE